MGYCNPRGRSPDGPSLTSLGVLRTKGTPETQQDEGLGLTMDPRRSLALMTRVRTGVGTRFLKPTVSTMTPARRRLFSRLGIVQPTPPRPPTVTRAGPLGFAARRIARARARAAAARAAAAERKAREAAQIREAERLAREAVIPPTVTNGAVWRPEIIREPMRPRVPDVGIAIACSPPRAPSPGMRCIGGRWYPARDGTEIPKIPSVRPWWLGRPPVGEIPSRDTSGIPTPPGLPGGPSMRPPASGPDDTADERVAPPPAEKPGGAALLPIAAGLAALMYMGG